MDPVVFLFVFLKSLIQYPSPVGDGLDEETHLRMEMRAKYLELERLRLEQELEQLSQEEVQLLQFSQKGEQLLQLLPVAALLALVLVRWIIRWKSSLRREENEEENHGANEEEVGNVAANEDDNDGIEAEVNGAAMAENNNDVANVVEEEDNDFDDHAGQVIMERIQWPVQDLETGCRRTLDLMFDFNTFFGHVLSDSFYPVLYPAIGVGSAFEGWSPREEDVVYRVLIPMTPPRGHSFHLELDSAEQRHVRNFRVRVQLECTCTRQLEGANMLCFLHHSEEELRRNQDPSLLATLCTDSYLDVEKTARWFRQLVKAIWPALPQSHNWHLTLLPSTRSCQFKVSYGEESFRIEMLFGVRRGDSAIFVSSQPREAYTLSTTWPESFAVAEAQFLRYIAWQAPPDSLHLKCLQFFSRLVLGFSFSTYTMKTIVMHLLNVMPVSSWRRGHLQQRLTDIRDSLRLCVQGKRLDHFIVGNRKFPENIKLPQDVRMSKAYNLFNRLVQQPAAHSQAVHDYWELHKSFKSIVHGED